MLYPSTRCCALESVHLQVHENLEGSDAVVQVNESLSV